MKIYGEITKLLQYAQTRLELNPLNVNYVRNEIIDMLSLPTFEQTDSTLPYDANVNDLLAEFTRVAVEENVFGEADAPFFCDKIMGALSLSPAEIDKKFSKLSQTQDSKAATDWFYDYCVSNDYVKKAILDRNPRFSRDGLIVTINLAKPEFRDPNKAKSGNAVQGGYPACVICRENEGFTKRGKRTLRTVSLKLNGKDWFWQYSPYGYFRQHGIAVNTVHTPMKIDRDTFVNLIDFVDRFPHYFVGCNAPLERIGGSVLAHDHYQGGGEILPLQTRGLRRIFKLEAIPSVTVGIVNWNGSVVRIAGFDKNAVVEASEIIRKAWKGYTNESLGIIANRDGVQFNEISPSVYLRNGSYEMNVILRSNITSQEYPDGVFHAHPEFHAIKKESIGLIEAQGLFILPGRLVGQLDAVEQSIVSGSNLPSELSQFQMLYDEIIASNAARERQAVHSAMEKELASICNRILANTAVFKNECDFAEFLKSCGFEEINYDYKVTASGRINVIGEHVDYCGGKVMPAAISLGNTVYARANGTDKVNIRWTTLPDRVTFGLDELNEFADHKHAVYQVGCLAVMREAGHRLIGCDLLYDCHVPFGSGLSSSAAIEVSTIAAVCALTGEQLSKKEIALLAQKAEREYAKVNCGIMDQYASANGLRDNALLLDCSTVTHEYVPIRLGEYVFVIANTNKPHSLVSSKYNERRQETEEAFNVLSKSFDVACLAEVRLEQLQAVKSLLSDKVYKRAYHVVSECSRVELATQAMQSGDMVSLGRLLNASHQSLRDDYEVSCDELDALQSLACQFDGCVGARMIGGGFGGCTLSLVKKNRVEAFKTYVGEKYKKQIGYDASFYDAEISDGVTVCKLK